MLIFIILNGVITLVVVSEKTTAHQTISKGKASLIGLALGFEKQLIEFTLLLIHC